MHSSGIKHVNVMMIRTLTHAHVEKACKLSIPAKRHSRLFLEAVVSRLTASYDLLSLCVSSPTSSLARGACSRPLQAFWLHDSCASSAKDAYHADPPLYERSLSVVSFRSLTKPATQLPHFLSRPHSLSPSPTYLRPPSHPIPSHPLSISPPSSSLVIHDACTSPVPCTHSLTPAATSTPTLPFCILHHHPPTQSAHTVCTSQHLPLTACRLPPHHPRLSHTPPTRLRQPLPLLAFCISLTRNSTLSPRACRPPPPSPVPISRFLRPHHALV